MKLARLLLRVTIGGIFIGHGTQKLFGWFDGHGLKSTAEMFDALGLKPAHVHATAAGVAETAGGTGLLLGFKTPFSASAVIAVMLTAINRVHIKNGPWVEKGGYEYNATLIAGAASLAALGPGKLSLDGRKARSGVFWGLASMVLGAVGAAGAHVFAETQKGGAGEEPATAAEAPTGADAAPATEAEAAAEDGAGATEPGAAREEVVDGEIEPETQPLGEPEST